MPRLLGECTPIFFSSQVFLEAYDSGIEAQCASERAFMTEEELISEVLQCLLRRWDHLDEKPISFEWSVGFLVGQLHALFVPALKYVNDYGIVKYKKSRSEEQEQPGEPATDPMSALTVAP